MPKITHAQTIYNLTTTTMKKAITTIAAALTLTFAACEAPEYQAAPQLAAQPAVKTVVPAVMQGDYVPHAGETVTGAITMQERVINAAVNDQNYVLNLNEVDAVVNSNNTGICNITITLYDGTVIKFVNFLDCCNRITLYVNSEVIGVFDKIAEK